MQALGGEAAGLGAAEGIGADGIGHAAVVERHARGCQEAGGSPSASSTMARDTRESPGLLPLFASVYEHKRPRSQATATRRHELR